MEQHQILVIERYKNVLAHVADMLQSADEGAWEDLIARQREYVFEIEQLANFEQDVQLDNEKRETKLDILARIRINEQHLHEKLQTRLSWLGGLMAESRNRMQVKEAYK